MSNNIVKASSDQGWVQAAQTLIEQAIRYQPKIKKMVIKEAKLLTPDKFRLTGWTSE